MGQMFLRWVSKPPCTAFHYRYHCLQHRFSHCSLHQVMQYLRPGVCIHVFGSDSGMSSVQISLKLIWNIFAGFGICQSYTSNTPTIRVHPTQSCTSTAVRVLFFIILLLFFQLHFVSIGFYNTNSWRNRRISQKIVTFEAKTLLRQSQSKSGSKRMIKIKTRQKIRTSCGPRWLGGFALVVRVRRSIHANTGVGGEQWTEQNKILQIQLVLDWAKAVGINIYFKILW